MSTAFELDHFSVFVTTEFGEVCLAEDVSLEVKRGETVCLVGESGSGKSVTLMSAMRLLEFTAPVRIEGSAKLDGTDVTTATRAEMTRIRGSRVGIVFQEAMDALTPTMTIGAQLVETYKLSRRGERRHPKASARARAMQLLHEVGMVDPAAVFSRYPHQLSGGMQQRAVIAIALIGDPELLIADEPTTALDVTIQAEILALLADIQQRRNMACIFVTHDMAVAAEISDRIYVMYAGQVIESGPTELVLGSPKHAYTKSLVECTPQPSVSSSPRMSMIPGSVPAPGQWPAGERFAPRNPLASHPHRATQPPPWHAFDEGLHLVRTWDPVDVWTEEDVLRLTGARDASECVPARPGGVAVSIEDLNMSYGRLRRRPQNPDRARRTIQALEHVSMSIQTHETFGIVGESGSGKSTLARLLLRLEEADSGSISFPGMPQGAMSARDREKSFRRHVQMVFQNPMDSLNPGRTVAQAIAEPLIHLEGLSARDARRAALDMLDAVKLPRAHASKRPHELSGGQRQRVAIARALAPQPKVLVADEPTSALDVSVQAQIINLLLDTQADFGLTLVLITHNLNLIATVADRIAVMHHGSLVEILDREAMVLADTQHEYTARLLAANPSPELLSRAE